MTNPRAIFTARFPDGGAGIMDIRSGRGRWHHLNTSAGALWHLITTGFPHGQAVNDLTDHFTSLGAPPGTVRADLAATLTHLQSLGLLSAPTQPAPTGPTPTVRPHQPSTTRSSPGDRAAALIALATTVTLLRLTPIRWAIALLRATRPIPATPAAASRADTLLQTVRETGRHWPVRLACLEESVAAYLAAKLRGQRVTWVIGARTAPASAHAWIEAEGQVIGQDTTHTAWPYFPALRL